MRLWGHKFKEKLKNDVYKQHGLYGPLTPIPSCVVSSKLNHFARSSFLKAFEQIAPTLYADIYVGENEGRQNDQLNQVMKKYFTLDL